MFVLLDTNVVSELIRKAPNPAVEAWAADRALEELHFSAIARSRDMAVATRNVRDFDDIDIKIVNPWTV